MNTIENFRNFMAYAIFIPLAVFPKINLAQENQGQVISYEDYADETLIQDEDYLTTLEEWQNMIDHWLENPLCINNEEADWLMEYKIISLFQLNTLKEYRFKYGILLSVHELAFIDGWDFQTVRKVIPLVTTILPQSSRIFDKFSLKSFRHNLLLKTGFNTQRGQGYQEKTAADESIEDPEYHGDPIRLSCRYDLEYRKKIAFGIRSEKDPGEPLLMNSTSNPFKLKAPDLFKVYLQLKEFGLLKHLILGNYRIHFGYGVNLSGSQFAIKSRNGMSGMASQIKPQTSVSESGSYNGISFLTQLGRFTLSGFASKQKIDGTAIVIDSLSGHVLYFSSIDRSGLHRTESEMANKKTIPEMTAGGFLVYKNNWLKTGLIAVYNKFGASVSINESPHARFGLTGNENFISGIAATVWLPGIQFFTESSISKNKGMAFVSGLQLVPSPGASIVIIHRYFDVNYQNWNGSGFISSSRNAGESGIQLSLRIELPKKWLIEFLTDHSQSQWVSYGLASPTRQRQFKISCEKTWPHSRSLVLSARYQQGVINDPTNSIWISHPTDFTRLKFRLEGRTETLVGIRLKSRIECNLARQCRVAWLIYQDIGFNVERLHATCWLRACLFEAMDFESRFTAYENDVLYDFTSFLHYGKGLRGVIMARFSPSAWFDLWIRLSTVYYTNKQAGSGWDAVDGNRQNEIEAQFRIRLAH